MKKIVLAILLSAVSIVGLNADKLDDYNDCTQGRQKSACQKLIDDGLQSVEQCDESSCVVVAGIYYIAEKYHQALPYLEKGCDLKKAICCLSAGWIYKDNQGVKQDFFKAKIYFEKGCNLNFGISCNELGILYVEGLGVKQDQFVAKKYFGKACDLGDQNGCSNYKRLNEQGIK